MQDWKMTDHRKTGVENAGLEFGGPNSRTGKCRTGKCRSKRFRFLAVNLCVLYSVLIIVRFNISFPFLCTVLIS